MRAARTARQEKGGVGVVSGPSYHSEPIQPLSLGRFAKRGNSLIQI